MGSVEPDVVLRPCHCQLRSLIQYENDETSTLVTHVASGLGSAIVPEPWPP